MRLITRSDFDGLACAVLLAELGMVDSMKFVHPKDVQDGIVQVDSNDIVVNLPYIQGCGLWFDHHSSEQQRQAAPADFKGMYREAPSCARVIYDYYGGREKFSAHFDALMAGVDKADAGNFTADEVLNPKGWALLSFVMDPRTGLGRFHDYRISNYQLMEDLVQYCRRMTVEEILALPDVQERVKRYHEQEEEFRVMLQKHTRVDGNVIVTDLRGVERILSGNRFVVYAIWPAQNISIWIIDGRGKQNCVFSVGHSIINRTSKTDVGALMLKYGGGGHKMVGTCQVPYADADTVLRDLIGTMRKDG